MSHGFASKAGIPDGGTAASPITADRGLDDGWRFFCSSFAKKVTAMLWLIVGANEAIKTVFEVLGKVCFYGVMSDYKITGGGELYCPG